MEDPINQVVRLMLRTDHTTESRKESIDGVGKAEQLRSN